LKKSKRRVSKLKTVEGFVNANPEGNKSL